MPDGARCDCKATKLLDLRIGAHRERIAFNVTTLAEHEVILGQGWLRWHNPVMHWQDGRAVIKRGHNEVTLYPRARGSSPSVGVDLVGGLEPLSAMQFAKAVKSGEDAFVALLRPVDRDRLDDVGQPHQMVAGSHGSDPRLASADPTSSGTSHERSAGDGAAKGRPDPADHRGEGTSPRQADRTLGLRSSLGTRGPQVRSVWRYQTECQVILQMCCGHLRTCSRMLYLRDCRPHVR